MGRMKWFASEAQFRKGALPLLLAISILASVVFAPGLALAKQGNRPEAKSEDEAIANSLLLKIDAPSTVSANEQFTIKVYQLPKDDSATDDDDDDKALSPVAGAKVYLLSRFGPLFKTDKKAEPVLPIESDETFLGTTDVNGTLTASIKDPGKYLIRAEKEIAPVTGETETSVIIGFGNILVFQKENKVVFTADKHVYTRGETVHFYVYNRSDSSITLTSMAPWSVTRPNGTQVFAPFSAQVLTEVKPGESKDWTWDQTTQEGQKAKPGIYIATLNTTTGKHYLKFNIAGLRFDKAHSNPEPTFPESSPFKDVTGEVRWGDPHILHLRNRHIVKGRTADIFDPDGTLTRAEFLALLLRATDADPELEEADDKTEETQGKVEGTQTTPESLPFPDVTPQHWAYRYIERAREMGIIKDEEYPNGFGPDAAINRLEICVMAIRAMGLEDEVESEAGQELAFQDREQVELRYRAYVKVATDWDVIRGFEDNTFRPNDKATRRQACVIIYRILQED